MLGQRIRNIRESKTLLLRQVAAFLEIDTAYLSKVERGERRLQKEQVQLLEGFFKVRKGELVDLWLIDRIYEVIEGHPNAISCLKNVVKQLGKNKD